MKHLGWIGIMLLLALAACDTTTREARRMVKQAELLADTLPDSTVRLIDSVLRMPVYFSERERMDMALLQAEVLFGDHGQDISPVMDDDFFDSYDNLSPSPELERAAAYFAQKKQYAKAAHAALYSGFVQQHYDEKEAAMRSFKEAEQYGLLTNDSLATARAEYNMGKKLVNVGIENESLAFLEKSVSGFGNHFTEKAMAQNLMAVCHMIGGDLERTETCLEQSLLYAERSQSAKIKRKVLNNFAVFYRQQGKYDHAADYLFQMVKEPALDIADSLFLCLNIGKVFIAKGEIDSAAFYFNRLETLLPNAKVKGETKVSAYSALANFAELQGNIIEALHYKNVRENLLSEIISQRQQKTIYRIQQQYDFETMRNDMNQKLIRKQRLITLIGFFAIIGLAALAISQIRLAKTRKQEAEAKNSLFHFMKQNKELAEKQETSEKALADLSMMHKADEKAYQDLIQKSFEIESACNTYAQQLSDALNKEALTMRKLDIFLKNREEKAYLAALKDAVFNNNEDHWEALMAVFDTLYPDVRINLERQHPELTEMEQKDFILSYFNVSRDEEARLFQKSIHTVDKLRNTVRQKMKQSVTALAPKTGEKT